MKNTITKLFAGAALLSLVLAGCSSLKEESGTAGKEKIKFSATIGSYQVKATDTAFEQGDAIGLFADYPIEGVWNLPMTWNNGSLTTEAPVYWGSSQYVDQASLFVAYYPYDAALEELYLNTFTVQEDQTTHEAYTASDLMIASTLAAPADGTVNLNFIHRMTKLVISVDNRLTDAAVSSITVGNVYLGVSGELNSDNELYPVGDPGSIKAGKVVLEDGSEAWTAILAPNQNITPSIIITTDDGKEYVYHSDYNVWFAPSRCYNAMVIIDESSISTDFTSNVTDWFDGGWFWFNQNVPSPYDGEWSLIGTIMGTSWDTDFRMTNVGGRTWYYKLAYHEGQEFKFRMNSDWSTNFGGIFPDDGGWQTVLQPGEATAMVQDGTNLMLPSDGYYDIYLDLDNQLAYVYYAGELLSLEGTVIWEGSAYMCGWNYDEGVNIFGPEYAWVNNNLQVGDEIRIYYDASDITEDYWAFQIYGPHWENLADAYYESSLYPETAGYVSYIMTEEVLSTFLKTQGWGGALIVLGSGNVEIKAVTLVAGGGSDGSRISDIVYFEDNTDVVTQPSLVMAKTTRGVIIADEKMAIYAYGADALQNVNVGDKVVIAANKTTYNGVPELANISSVEIQSSWNEVYYPQPIDITPYASGYNSNVAEFVSLTGTLSKSGSYYNIALDGISDKIGSIVSPVADLDADSYDGKKITVTGYFNGLSGGGKYINIVVVSIEERIDWSDIEGVTEGYHTVKALLTDNYLYINSFRTAEGRYSEIWGGSGYVYMALNLDGDDTTGVELWGNGPYEFIGVTYPYVGTSDEPLFDERPSGTCVPEDYTLENIRCRGTATEAGAELEIAIPRADIPELYAGNIVLSCWGNKDLSRVTLNL